MAGVLVLECKLWLQSRQGNGRLTAGKQAGRQWTDPPTTPGQKHPSLDFSGQASLCKLQSADYLLKTRRNTRLHVKLVSSTLAHSLHIWIFSFL